MSTKNVFIMTCGGLGNQLFQIAFGFYLLQHDISVYVPDIYKLTAYPGENRHTYWDTFPCPFHKISKEKKSCLKKKRSYAKFSTSPQYFIKNKKFN